ncbi:MAG: V-type ATP synthase subunit I, partial [Treponema sp.]|nr:V-type ATP synthase subunit I [Treponema sp.]
MKRVQLTVLRNDANAVIEYLGHRAAMHFGDTDGAGAESEEFLRIKEQLLKIRTGAEFLGIDLPSEPEAGITFPGEGEAAHIEELCAEIDTLLEREMAAQEEKRRVEETYNEAKAFSSLNAPFSDLDQLTYLTLR